MIRKINVGVLLVLLSLCCFYGCDRSTIDLGENYEIVYQNNVYNYCSEIGFPTEYCFSFENCISIGTLYWSYMDKNVFVGYSEYDSEVNILYSTIYGGTYWIKEGFGFPNYKEVSLLRAFSHENHNTYFFNNITFGDLIESELDEIVEGEKDLKYIYLTLEEMPYLHIKAYYFSLNGQGYLIVNESGIEIVENNAYYLLKSEYLEVFESLCQF